MSAQAVGACIPGVKGRCITMDGGGLFRYMMSLEASRSMTPSPEAWTGRRTSRGAVRAIFLRVHANSRRPAMLEYSAQMSRKRQKRRCREMMAGMSHRPSRVTSS